MVDKEGKRVPATSDGVFQLDADGKMKLTNVNGHCGECCRENDPCQLSVCGPTPTQWATSIDYPHQPIDIPNLPYLRHTFGYGQYCDLHFKLLQSRDTWWNTEEDGLSFTELKIECETDGTTTFSNEIIYYDNDDPLPISWREWERKTDAGAWPIYKMTPTFNEATNELSVAVGWRRDKGTEELIFQLPTVSVSATADISYSGSGSVKSTSNKVVVLEDTEDGGTGVFTCTLQGHTTVFALRFLTHENNSPWLGVHSKFNKIRSHQSYGTDSASLTYEGDGNCLVCSNYELIDVEMEIGECVSNWQLAATKTTRPWYWCGSGNVPHEAHGLEAYNDDIITSPERYDLKHVLPPAGNVQYEKLGPGQPITTVLYGPPSPETELMFDYQTVHWIELNAGMEFWLNRSPRGIKHPIASTTFLYGDDRWQLIQDRWWETGLPPQDSAADFNLPIHNAEYNYWQRRGFRAGDRATIKHPNKWPELTHPGAQKRKMTSTATLEFFEPDPPMWDPEWGGGAEQYAVLNLGGVDIAIWFWDDGLIHPGQGVYGAWEIYFNKHFGGSSQILGPVGGHFSGGEWHYQNAYQPWTFELTADLPNVYDLGFSGLGTLAPDTYTENIHWNVKLNGVDLVDGKLKDHGGALSVNKNHPLLPPGWWGADDLFYGFHYPGPPNALNTNLGLDRDEVDGHSLVPSKQVGYALSAYCEDGNVRDKSLEVPIDPNLLNKPTKMMSFYNVTHKIEYV